MTYVNCHRALYCVVCIAMRYWEKFGEKMEDVSGNVLAYFIQCGKHQADRPQKHP